MQLLKDRIIKEGRILEGNVIKVDSFLNHQVDVNLINEVGRKFKSLFQDVKVDKILTAETSGIAIAAIVAQYFNAPMVFARKTESKNLDKDTYTSEVYSYTKAKTYKIRVSKKYLREGENILIIDDFLANGKALEGLIDIVKQAKASLVGIGVVIEKGFQEGGRKIREKGIRLESLAIIDSIEGGEFRFRE
ncbi:MAG: xanthine phosphoribosyltransferase [Tissierellia bacterium]|nr:xanthine phosphoribosyltransferase [Tissierellia bacterium]